MLDHVCNFRPNEKCFDQVGLARMVSSKIWKLDQVVLDQASVNRFGCLRDILMPYEACTQIIDQMENQWNCKYLA